MEGSDEIVGYPWETEVWGCTGKLIKRPLAIPRLFGQHIMKQLSISLERGKAVSGETEKPQPNIYWLATLLNSR